MINKKFYVILILALGAGAWLPPRVNALETARYIDMSRAFGNYYKTVRAQKSLQQQEKIYQERAEEIAEEIKELHETGTELEERSLNIAVSEEVREQSRRQARATENLYQAKQKQLQNFVQQKQGELRQHYMSMRNELVEEIIDLVKRHAETNGYSIIFDVSGMTSNMLPAIIHYPEDKEITAVIIAQLNKGFEDEVPEGGVEGMDTPELVPGQ